MTKELIKGFSLSLAVSLGIFALGFGGMFLLFSPSTTDSFAFIGGLAAVSLGAPLIILGVLLYLCLKYRNSRPDYSKGILYFFILSILFSLIIWYFIKFS